MLTDLRKSFTNSIIMTSICWNSLHSDKNLRGPHVKRQHPSIDICCLQASQQRTLLPPLLLSIDGTDRQTDGRTDTRPFYDAHRVTSMSDLLTVGPKFTPPACHMQRRAMRIARRCMVLLLPRTLLQPRALPRDRQTQGHGTALIRLPRNS